MTKTFEQLQQQVKDFFFMNNVSVTLNGFEESTLDHVRTVSFDTVMEATDFLVRTYGEDALFDGSLNQSRHFVFDNGDIWKNRADPHCRFSVTRDFWYVIEYDAVYAEKNPTLFITCEENVERKAQRNTNDEKTEDELLRELLTADEFKALQLYRECQYVEFRKHDVPDQEAIDFVTLADTGVLESKRKFVHTLSTKQGKIRTTAFIDNRIKEEDE
ncbi:hypothetical protein HBP99_04095 [Listeria booriae]|uniref:hypothetical protein n=1 Tax=Listeria booriae TaxID=1552123 RepID=UPI0016265456|nr:hypothetical protein [Listeria booriae]MBC2367801.1 hypothetical protein [Listeria booriae]